ncbi:hypothetical protein CH333_02815 [candidate division WOR-3 bacterium JGI_Cruoil_03_44_89]|uniref:LytR/CpsA/Psr regulator C-terminal domain-containing protein n=1 Tax=candidate division WOR-3 bacterium JGI_Cruoil_03_44_89 TaxID=1973748 RepID=A0A235BWV5_UNCW3|nr:MAG: hypothetical protein CH333_02815 [candidate division WOR-3 bacterium JGI_Cruoil_03_44_89]
MKKVVSLIIIIIGFFSVILLVSSVDKIRDELAARKPQKIRMVVLNGTSIDDLAAETADFLQKNGCDILQIGNATSPHKKTVILDRSNGDLKKARRIRHLLGVGEMAYEPDPTHIVGVTVILGEDYKPEQ